MTNTVNILERTLAQVADSTNDLHTLGTANGRLSVYEPLVVRITDHADDDNSEVDADTSKMALFCSQRHGEPFKKDVGEKHLLHSAGQGFTGTFTATAGVIDGVTITAGGTGYSDLGTVVIDGDAGGNADAVLTPTIVDGVVTALAITGGGTGYTTGALVITNVTPTDATVIFPDFDYSTF